MDKLNGTTLLEMLESGNNNLNNHQSEINALNVFPVPDGDTGTNMSLTSSNGIAEAVKSGSKSLPVVAKTFSRGLLMGARGNSGVILSQIFRGFAKEVQALDELTVRDLSNAFLSGSKMAYKAVMRPVEGTILTVVRESTEQADAYLNENPEATLVDYIDTLCAAAKVSLDHTPELLPVLKEARVVDSGGSGLLCVFEGFRAYLHGEPVRSEKEGGKKTSGTAVQESGYCVEFIVNLSERGAVQYNDDKVRSVLEKLGNELTLIRDDNTVKVRINTRLPGDVLNQGQRYGEFEEVQVYGLSKPTRPSIFEIRKEAPEIKEEKEYGIITVAAGEGLKKLFTDYRADVVVSGGQTMNPSTEDFVSAISSLNARHVFILPNNSNIIMAAKQAAEVSEGKDVIVIETKSIPQGLSACMAFNPDGDTETNLNAMSEAVASVKTGQVTYSIKDTVVDGREIHEGDFMGLLEKDIVLTDPDKVTATKRLLDEICDEDTEIITLIKGEDVTEEEFAEVQAYIEDTFEVDLDAEDGGQPVYSFIIGAE